MFNKSKAGDLAREVIVKFIEGGYYHPNMYYNGAKSCDGGKISAKTFQPVYRISGETMFGQDRTAGHDLFYSTKQPDSVYKLIGGRKRKVPDPFLDIPLIEGGAYQYKSDDAREFWTTIDRANAKNNWCWGYMGGNSQNRLMELAGRIMYDEFVKYYLPKFPIEIQNGIHIDDALASNVFYTVWNGPGWRNRYIARYKKLRGKNIPTNTADINRLFLQARKEVGTGRDSNAMLRAVKQGLNTDILSYKTGTVIDLAKKKNIGIFSLFAPLQEWAMSFIKNWKKNSKFAKRRR